jgi:hypothetical protein
MINLMDSLEPIRFRKLDLLVDEMEEVESVYFMMDGWIKIGYRINQRMEFPLMGHR